MTTTFTPSQTVSTAMQTCRAAREDLEAGDSVGALKSMRWAIDDLERAQKRLVAEMRGAGVSWQVIGDALLLTRQGAQQRFRDIA